jgi:hypothetical protein
MDLLKLLEDTVPDAGPNARQSIQNAQQRLEMLQTKNPQEAKVLSRQLGEAISQRADPSFVLESIGKSYGIQLGKQSPASTEDKRPRDEETAAAIASINALATAAGKRGQNVDPTLIEATINLAQKDPKTAMEIARSSIPTMSAADQAKIDKEKQEAIQESISNIDSSEQFADVLQSLKDHEGFTNVFGTNFGIPTWMAGTDAADAKAIFDQVDSKAFMQSIKSLKGMGALSDAEGKKAGKAYIALTTTMSEKAARKSIDDTKKILDLGVKRARAIVGEEILQNQDAVDPAAKNKQNRDEDIDAATQGLRKLPQ